MSSREAGIDTKLQGNYVRARYSMGKSGLIKSKPSPICSPSPNTNIKDSGASLIQIRRILTEAVGGLSRFALPLLCNSDSPEIFVRVNTEKLKFRFLDYNCFENTYLKHLS